MPFKDKARQRAYMQKPEVKARKRAYMQKPEVKARQRAYMRKYFSKPEVKARQRAYMQKPEVKARQRAYHSDIALICRRTELAADGVNAVVKEIKAGRRYIDIAVDWLIDEADVGDIARVHKLGRKSRGRGSMRAAEARP